MKIKYILIVLLLLFSNRIDAQTKKSDYIYEDYSFLDHQAIQIPDSLTRHPQKIADYINLKFSSEEEKLRAIFKWITENIEYDTQKEHSLDINVNESTSSTLITRKGVCYNYVKLFYDLASKLNIKSNIIFGYTKQQGKVDPNIHAWCAARIDSNWQLFDPTWGSGLIQKAKYIKHFDDNYFKSNPKKLIESHMPFDPQWQLLYYPITHKNFTKGRELDNEERVYFNFVDSLKAYEKRPRIDKLIAEKRRIENNSNNNKINENLISRYLTVLNKNINVYYFNKNAERYNKAIESYNKGILLFNNFVDYWNNEFKPYKGDDYIQQKLDSIVYSFEFSVNTLNSIYKPNKEIMPRVNELYLTIEIIMISVNEQKAFFDKYLITERKNRKLLFYR